MINLKLIEKRQENENVTTFIFKPRKKLKWKAGQYLIYSLPHKNADLRGKMRFFTISSAPFEKFPAITTRIFAKQKSTFKDFLSKLKINDTILAKGPDGDFILNNLKKEYVFIAGGIGITPFYSMLKQLENDKKNVKITLLYSNRTSDFIFKKTLDDISKKYINLKIIYILHPKKIDISLLKKYGGNNKIFYISGPDPMVEKIEKMLIKLGINKEYILEDYFSGYNSI